MKLTAIIITLGCRLNQADAALITDRLDKAGLEIISREDPRPVNLIVINSCAVTETAYKKSIQLMKSIHQENPQAFIVFTGCAADTYANELANRSDIDLVLKNEDKKNIVEYLSRHLATLKARALRTDTVTEDGYFLEHATGAFPFRSRAFLKIQEGCDNYCSYCIVPYARGHERSRDIDEIIAEFKEQIEAGYHEIVLTGVNVCHYDCRGLKLPDLLDKLCEIPGDFRIRLSSTEPGDEILEIIAAMKRHADKICPFLHLALQHGSNEILKSMNRHYTVEQYINYVKAARKSIPNLHLGTDIIIGYPGETDKNFAESLEVIKKLKFANIHIFPFSPRKGTPAAEMPKELYPTHAEIQQRQEQLKAVKEESAAEFAQSLIGSTGTVLLEISTNENIWEGWSGNYVRTLFRSEEDMSRKLVKVKFTRSLPSGALVGRLADEADEPPKK